MPYSNQVVIKSDQLDKLKIFPKNLGLKFCNFFFFCEGHMLNVHFFFLTWMPSIDTKNLIYARNLNLLGKRLVINEISRISFMINWIVYF